MVLTPQGIKRLKYASVASLGLGTIALTVFGAKWAQQNYFEMPTHGQHASKPPKENHSDSAHEDVAASKRRKPSASETAAESESTTDEELAAARIEAKRQRQAEQLVRKSEASEKHLCNSVEIPGKGPEGSVISAADWAVIHRQYHQAKAELMGWLEAHQKEFSKKNFAFMRAQIKEMRVQRPTTPQEPDLSWRGIGVMTSDDRGALIRLGGGVPELMLKDPHRGRFEMVRLLAQAWAPKEFEKNQLVSPWTGALSCLGVKDAASGEAIWAISTAVARELGSPGCRIPAFTDETRGCLKKVSNGSHS